MTKLHIDIETCSSLDLKKVGTHVYAEHPSTEILCVAYAIDDQPVRVWRTVQGEPVPADFLNAWVDGRVEIHAWNAGGFEMIVFPYPLLAAATGRPGMNGYTPLLHRWRDTMIQAAYWGLPMRLERAAAALNSAWTKDMAGHRLMLQMSRPRKDGSFWHKTDPAKYDRLCAYCAQDVEVEREIGSELPELPDFEQRLWEIDYKMMSEGVPVDYSAVTALEAVARTALFRLNGEMQSLTGGRVQTTNAVAALLNYCHDEMGMTGVPPHVAAQILPSTSKDDIDAFLSELEDWRTHVIHRTSQMALKTTIPAALKIRKEAAKSSVAKLAAMQNCVTAQGNIHGLTQFYGASRTGRFAGRLVQIQNLPRGLKGFDPNSFIDAMCVGLNPPPNSPYTALERVSASLRGCFKPKTGKFIVGDYSQIEARVVAWLAGQQDILEVFARGEDVYTYTAAKLNSADRQFGKVLVLACGFGMGWRKFQDTAKTYGIVLDDNSAKLAVTMWRDASKHIVAYWKELEHAARAVINGKSKMKVWNVRNIKMAMGTRKLAGCFLIGLPSGRHLVYRNARLVDGNDGFPPRIVYDGMNQVTRNWEAQDTYGGKLCENIVQAVARDLLCHAVERLDNFRVLTPLVTIHDEIVCVPNVQDKSEDILVGTLKTTMELKPAWAEGLPVAADVKAMERYAK